MNLIFKKASKVVLKKLDHYIVLKNDVEIARNNLPYVFGQMRNNTGVDSITSFLNEQGGLPLN